MVLGSSTDSYLAAIASLTARDIYFRHWNTDATDAQQLRVARWASVLFAAVILVGTEAANGTIGFVQLLLIGGIGASALVGPFALSLFWDRTSTNPFIVGIIVSQLVTFYLLFGNASLPGWVQLKLWEIMAVGHVLSTGFTFLGSLITPDNFVFEDIAGEPAQTDGGRKDD